MTAIVTRARRRLGRWQRDRTPVHAALYGWMIRRRRAAPPRYALAVCAIFRDEAPDLAEWVVFHRLQGVEQFWLYDNRSTDDWRAALHPELDAGIVTVADWPATSGGQQFTAYSDCLERHRDDARWIAFLDLDEFLFSPTGAPLPSILERFARHPAVAVNWRAFGPGGHRTRPEGLVTESYVRAARADRNVNRIVKSIVQPRLTAGVSWNPHVFRCYGTAVGEDGRRQVGPRRVPPTADLLRVNHYISKSQEEWERKVARPGPDYATRKGYKLPPDDEEDVTIQRFLPQLRRALATRPRI